MSRAPISTALIGAVLAVAPLAAHAQLPLPFFGGDDPPAKKTAKPEASEEEAPRPDKTYVKPPPLVLPEGEARVLSGPIALVDFKTIVSPGIGEHTVRAIQRAELEGMQAVLIELDTPGGLVSTTQKIVQGMMKSKVPVIVYVTPSGAHAASAGTIITMAAHVAAMAPATRIGAAHPVTGGGKDPEAEGGKHMGRKIENDLAAMIEGIASERGRNQEWAIDAVRDSVSITARNAAEIGVVDLVAEDRRALLDALDGRELGLGGQRVRLSTKGVTIIEIEPTIRERLVGLLANPGIAMILGMLGVIGIMIEIYHPGVIAPGVMGVLCIICSLIAAEQLPIDLGGALLVLAGIGLLIAEMYTPTYGALGLLCVLGLSAGLLLLVDPSDPEFAIDPSVRLTPMDVMPVVLGFAAMVAFISIKVLGAQRRQVVTGHEGLLGQIGETLEPIDGEGMVLLDGEYWRARSAAPIAKGSRVEVVAVEGLVVQVKPRGSSA